MSIWIASTSRFLRVPTGASTGEACQTWARVLQKTSPSRRCSPLATTTKTDIEKWLPVHPAPHELVLAWKQEGWGKYWALVVGFLAITIALALPLPRKRTPRDGR